MSDYIAVYGQPKGGKSIMITCTNDGQGMVASSIHYIEECGELRVWMICERCGHGFVITYDTCTKSEFLIHRTD
jgi:hypothetical protein